MSVFNIWTCCNDGSTGGSGGSGGIETAGFHACALGLGAQGVPDGQRVAIEIVRNEDGTFNRYIAHPLNGVAAIDPVTEANFEACPTGPDNEVFFLCDDNGSFLRRLNFPESGPITTTDTTLDGQTPYVTSGTVRKCQPGYEIEEIAGCVVTSLDAFGNILNIIQACIDAAALDIGGEVAVYGDGSPLTTGNLAAPFDEANILLQLNSGPNGPGFSVVNGQLVFDLSQGGTAFNLFEISPADDLPNVLYSTTAGAAQSFRSVKIVQTIQADEDGTNPVVIATAAFEYPSLNAVVLAANQSLSLDCFNEEPKTFTRELVDVIPNPSLDPTAFFSVNNDTVRLISAEDGAILDDSGAIAGVFFHSMVFHDLVGRAVYVHDSTLGEWYYLNARDLASAPINFGSFTGTFPATAPLSSVFDNVRGFGYMLESNGTLHRVNFNTRVIDNLGSLSAGTGFTGLSIGPDGTLYAIANVASTTEIWTIDRNTLLATQIGTIVGALFDGYGYDHMNQTGWYATTSPGGSYFRWTLPDGSDSTNTTVPTVSGFTNELEPAFVSPEIIEKVPFIRCFVVQGSTVETIDLDLDGNGYSVQGTAQSQADEQDIQRTVNPTFQEVTGFGFTPLGAYQVSISNVGAAVGNLNGQNFPVGASVTYTAYYDNSERIFRRLGHLYYDATGTTFIVSVTP